MSIIRIIPPPPPPAHSLLSQAETPNYPLKNVQSSIDIPVPLSKYYDLFFGSESPIKKQEEPKTNVFFKQVTQTMKEVHKTQAERMMRKIKRKILQNARIGESEMIMKANDNFLVIQEVCDNLTKEGFKTSFWKDYATNGCYKISISWGNA